MQKKYRDLLEAVFVRLLLVIWIVVMLVGVVFAFILSKHRFEIIIEFFKDMSK